MTLCLNCQKEVEPKEGKRAKKYCSDSCRATFYQKNRPKGEKKYVLMKTHKDLEEKYKSVVQELAELKGKVKLAGGKPIMDAPPKKYVTEDESPQSNKKPMPEGLSKSAQLRWMRENQ
jgi:endogenous inhibitor of DNA gyrase (YacG/DUF329 family)